MKTTRINLELNTYLKAPPDPNPRYFEGRMHEGVARHFYPYPVDDNLTDNLSAKSYEAYQLENEYLKITIIPELGGRIYSALDKTNNYEFVYRNVVIKPSLIGMVGSWISGGIAWGFPHHHGPLTMAPFEHRCVENPDGSETVWLAKTDYRHRMRMRLGITLRPGTSYVEAEVFLDNRTPLVNSFLYWANMAVKADPDLSDLLRSVGRVRRLSPQKGLYPLAGGRRFVWRDRLCRRGRQFLEEHQETCLFLLLGLP